MKRHSAARILAILIAVPAVAVCLFAQSAANTTVVINGKAIPGALREIDGRPYVDLELVAQALGASVNFESHRISLNLPAPPPAPASGAPSGVSTAQNPQRVSQKFAIAGISALAAMRQWQGAVETVIRFGIPANGSWPQDYHDNAEAGLNQARVAASTAGDQSALQLLENEFTSLGNWSNSVITERQSLQAARFVNPNALAGDSALAKISNCSRFLGSMVGRGVFSDGSSCH